MRLLSISSLFDLMLGLLFYKIENAPLLSMIFSRESFKLPIQHEADFFDILTYKGLKYSYHVRQSKALEITIAKTFKEEKWSYITKRNVFKLSTNNKEIMNVPYYQKNPTIIYNTIALYAGYIKFIPEDLLTPCHAELVSRTSMVPIEYIPDRLKTYQMALKAVRVFPAKIEYIPDHLKTPELIEIAAKVAAQRAYNQNR